MTVNEACRGICDPSGAGISSHHVISASKLLVLDHYFFNDARGAFVLFSDGGVRFWLQTFHGVR